MGGGLTPSSLPESLALAAAFISSINIAGLLLKANIKYIYFNTDLLVSLPSFCVCRRFPHHPEDVGHVQASH